MNSFFVDMKRHQWWIVYGALCFALVASLAWTSGSAWSMDMVQRLSCLYIMLWALLMYHAPSYGWSMLWYGLYYLLIAMSMNPVLSFFNAREYVSWIVFGVDITAAVILYISGNGLLLSFKYYLLHFLSWLLIFAPCPLELSELCLILGLVFRLCPMLMNVWGRDVMRGKSILGLSLVLVGNMSMVLDLARFWFTNAEKLFTHNLNFNVLLWFGDVNLSQFLVQVGLILFVYYCGKSFGARSFNQILWHMYQALSSLLFSVVLQLSFADNFGYVWREIIFNSWCAMMWPWVMGACILQLGVGHDGGRRGEPSHVQDHLAGMTAWNWLAWLVGMGALSWYLSTVYLFGHYFSVFGVPYLFTSSLPLNSLILFGLGIMGVFWSLLWSVTLRRFWRLGARAAWIIPMLFIAFALQGLAVQWLWGELVVLPPYSIALSYALSGDRTQYLVQGYFILSALGLFLLNYFWTWWFYVARMFQSLRARLWGLFTALPMALTRVGRWITRMVRISSISGAYFANFLIFSVAQCMHRGINITPGMASACVMYLLTVLLLSHYL